MDRLIVRGAQGASAVIELTEGDITRERVDAIVNAANRTLLGGGGVDGAIHRAGGPRILEACRQLGGCPTGEARLTTGGNLPARFVIHAVGPVYGGGYQGEAQLLASAYRSSLALADEQGLESIAFPSIGTGAYRYPVREASRVALSSVKAHLTGRTGLRRVRFVLFSRADYEVYRAALAELAE